MIQAHWIQRVASALLSPAKAGFLILWESVSPALKRWAIFYRPRADEISRASRREMQ